MRKALSLLLVAILILSTTPFVTFADQDKDKDQDQESEATIILNVQLGGTAFVNGYEYQGSSVSYSIPYDANTNLTINSYSNAGFTNNGFIVDGTHASGRNLAYTVVADGSITVQFISSANVFEMPSYVLDGGFSGYDPTGLDISTHNPKEDILAATLTATPNKALYLTGENANIALTVDVSDGDYDTKFLNEVAYYQNGLNPQLAGTAPSSPGISYTYAIPNTPSELINQGFVYDSTTNTFNKTFNYSLVDIYNGDDAAQIIATATAKISVKYHATIYMTMDNRYELYINGVQQQTPVFTPSPTNYPWQSVRWYDADLKEGDVIAVKGIDDGVIAGFLADIYFNGDVYPTAVESYWRQSLVGEAGWNNKGFVPTSNWSKTFKHTSTAWTGLKGLPSGSKADWVWSKNNNFGPTGEPVVYFRYVVGGKNIDKPVDPTNTPPTIELKGASTINLFVGEVYSELGATATDKEDGTLTPVVTGSVDTTKVGSYTITYTATDSKEATASVTRTVIVSLPEADENTPPAIELKGASTINLFLGEVYSELGATATDKEDGTLTPVITGSVDTTKVGSYTITYTATDSKEATASVTRTVIVVAKPPVVLQPSNEAPETAEAPAAADAEVVDLGTDEAVAAGAANIMNFDELVNVPAVAEETVAEEVELFLDPTPLADALPQTGQLPVELFYGVGGLITAAGVFLKKRK